MNRTAIFNALRATPGFGGKLSISQVQGTTLILDYFERKAVIPEHGSYMLATTAWETAYTMQPIDEKGGDAYFTRLYDISGTRPKLAQQYGNVLRGDGIKFHGRGDIQLTWHDNYKAAGDYLGIDLVGNPALALDPLNAVKIMWFGMKTGMFTGHKLAEYLGNGKLDWVNARRIINGTDHANEIAAIAKAIFIGYAA